MGRKAEGEAEDSNDKLEPVGKNFNLTLITSSPNDPSPVEKGGILGYALQRYLVQDLENLKKEI